MRGFPLIILVLLFLAAPIAQAQETLVYGQVVSGEFTADQTSFSYTFEGAEGDQIYIFMHIPSADFPALVRLTALGGVVIAEAEANNPTGALLGPLVLEGNLSYTVEATYPEWATGSTGAFSLVVDRANPTPLEPGVETSGNLPGAGTIAFFTFKGNTGDVMRYRATGSNLGVGVVLPDGAPASYDGVYDDPASLFNVLPQDGDYTLFIQTTNTGGTDYTITVKPLDVYPLVEGQPVSGSNAEIDPVILSFESEQGKLLAINATVPDADARTIAIFPASDPCCDVLRDYGSGPNGNPRIDPFIVPESGTYYVVLWYDLYSQPNAVLDYEVTLGASTLISLSSGVEITDTVTPESGIKTYSYNASLGETLRLSLTQTGGQGWPSIRVTGPEGQIAYFEGTSVRNLSIELVFPVAGLYRFEIGNIHYEPTAVEYTLRVE